MITANNLKKMLEILGFEQQGQLWKKHFAKVNCDMSVDFKNKRLYYPDDTFGSRRKKQMLPPEIH